MNLLKIAPINKLIRVTVKVKKKIKARINLIRSSLPFNIPTKADCFFTAFNVAMEINSNDKKHRK